MFRFKPALLVFFSGLVWIGIGFSLLTRGLEFLMNAVAASHNLADGASPLLLARIAPSLGGLEEAAIIVIALALFVGYLKGNYVLSRSVARFVTRLSSLPSPLPIYRMYAPTYYLLIGLMILLGLSMKWLGVPIDIRGFVCTAIGSALLNGALIHFRYSLAIRKVQRGTSAIICDKETPDGSR